MSFSFFENDCNKEDISDDISLILLRACSKSFEQQAQESQVDELQTGVKQPLAVLP